VALRKQRAAVHAPLHAAVDAILQQFDRTFPRPVLRELSPNADEWHGIGLPAGLQVAIFAGKIVAGETPFRVRSSRPISAAVSVNSREPYLTSFPNVSSSIVEMSGALRCTRSTVIALAPSAAATLMKVTAASIATSLLTEMRVITQPWVGIYIYLDEARRQRGQIVVSGSKSMMR
jgi:hypothetical protein